ncbi:MAG: ABC transporter permease [Bacteroidales bacterium]|nr:ABC transporter permease [Bacteroidales bacterium]
MYHNIKSILTSVRKNPFFYTINLIGFLTGFLVLSIIFNFVFQELSFDKFHKNSENIYRINSNGYGVTPPCFAEKLKDQIPEINGIIRFHSEQLTLIDQNTEIFIGKVNYTDVDVFNHFSFQLLSGNADDVLKLPFSIVINQSTADKLFKNDSPIGKNIQTKDGRLFTVTAIMEDIPYQSHIQAQAFISMESLKHTEEWGDFSCGSWSILTYLRLNDHANYKEVEEKVNTILYEFRMGTDEGKFRLNLQPLIDVYFDADNNKFDGSKHGNKQTVFLYFAISLLILLIVIINYVNLSTLIAGGRTKEIALRKINGATRFNIVQQALFEALFMILIAFVIAFIILEALLPQLSNLLNVSIADSQDRSFLYVYYFISIAIIGLLSGLIPGIFLSKVNEIKALKNESFLSSRGYQRKALLVIQLLIVAVFLNVTGIMNNQIHFILNKEIGYNYDNVVYFELNEDLTKKWEVLKSKLLQNPEIKSVSFSNGLIGNNPGGAVMECNEKKKLSHFYMIDPDYIELYEMKMKSGRNFSWDFKTDFDQHCIVNEAFCKVFELTNPIGEKIGKRTISGVVHDFNYTSLHYKISPLIIFCDKGEKTIQIRISSENKEETNDFIRDICKELSPDYNCDFCFLDNRIRDLYESELDLKNSFQVYSIITFIIALLGLFGLFLFTIKKKTKEISLRKLFGANLHTTFKLLAKEQILIVSLSNILAVPIIYLVMTNWLNKFQFSDGIGIMVFIKTYFISLCFTLMTILFLIIKTHRANILESIKHQ